MTEIAIMILTTWRFSSEPCLALSRLSGRSLGRRGCVEIVAPYHLPLHLGHGVTLQRLSVVDRGNVGSSAEKLRNSVTFHGSGALVKPRSVAIESGPHRDPRARLRISQQWRLSRVMSQGTQ